MLPSSDTRTPLHIRAGIPSRRHLGKEHPVHPTVRFTVGREPRVAISTFQRGVAADAILIRSGQTLLGRAGVGYCSTMCFGKRHGLMMTERRFTVHADARPV